MWGIQYVCAMCEWRDAPYCEWAGCTMCEWRDAPCGSGEMHHIVSGRDAPCGSGWGILCVTGVRSHTANCTELTVVCTSL